MAEQLQEVHGVDVKLVSGARGEFSVRVEDKIVAKKSLMGFPDDDACIQAVGRALETA